MSLNKFQELYFALRTVAECGDATTPPIPLFSFEGLPGAGKTTQIQLVSEALKKKYEKVFYIDLPTQTSFGRLLKTLYKNQENWEYIRKEIPWLNPLLISVNLREAIEHAVASGAKCALMSRGIISTYYYNLDAFSGKNFDDRWSQMKKFMKAFYLPTAIIFLEISEKEANRRVIQRNRGPLRKMDQIEQMKQDKIFLLSCLKKLPDIPIEYIDGEKSPQSVTQSIMSVIEKFLEGE